MLISSADDAVAARSLFDLVTMTGQKHQDAYCKVCKTQHGVLLLTLLHHALKFELHVPRSGYCCADHYVSVVLKLWILCRAPSEAQPRPAADEQGVPEPQAGFRVWSPDSKRCRETEC